MQSTRAVRAEYTNCTQCLRFGLDLIAATGGFAFGSSFAPAFFVAFFPLLPALSICGTTAAVSSASATLGTFSRLRLAPPAGWERGRVLGKCATYELSTTCYTGLL